MWATSCSATNITDQYCLKKSTTSEGGPASYFLCPNSLLGTDHCPDDIILTPEKEKDELVIKPEMKGCVIWIWTMNVSGFNQIEMRNMNPVD